jgi:hypothetical protein
MKTKKPRTSTCIHCGRKITEKQASEEYINAYHQDGLVWFDTEREDRALCMIDRYSTAHVTKREWSAGN